MRVTSLTINEDHVKKVAHHHVDMEANDEKWIREPYRKELNEEFHFTDILGSDGDRLIVPAKNTKFLTSVMIY